MLANCLFLHDHSVIVILIHLIKHVNIFLLMHGLTEPILAVYPVF